MAHCQLSHDLSHVLAHSLRHYDKLATVICHPFIYCSTPSSCWSQPLHPACAFVQLLFLLSLYSSVWLNMPFSAILVLVCCFEGLIMYAFYNGGSLEPFVTAEPGVTEIMPDMRSPPNLTSKDQILVYFVSEQFGNIPGYQGLFIACIMAGALRSVLFLSPYFSPSFS